MVAPVGDSYTAGTDRMIYAGVERPYPAWRPAAGTFVNLGTDTLASVKPSGWPSSESGGPFANWGTLRWNPDFGAAGGLVSHCSGHLNIGQPIWAGVWVFDAASLSIVGRNVPAAPLVEGDAYNGYFESEETGTEGHTYVPHQYGGLVIQSAANGGGADGSLIRNFYAGSTNTFPQCVHRFDLSSATDPATRVINAISMGGSSGSYAAACVDEERGGYWLNTYNGQGPLKFVSFADWSVTSHSGVEYSAYGDQMLIKLPPPYDAIVALGRNNGDSSIWSYHVSLITGSTPSAFTAITPTGTAPNESKDGASWCSMLGQIVAKPNRGTTDVFKLTIPATRAELISGSWSWSTESVTGAGGATWAERANDDSGQYGGGLVEAPELGVLLHWDGIGNRVQALRLAGM